MSRLGSFCGGREFGSVLAGDRPLLKVATLCSHGGRAETTFATDLLIDLSGFFPCGVRDQPELLLIHGSPPVQGTSAPAVLMPCWRCSPTLDSDAVRHTQKWLLRFLRKDSQTRESEHWTSVDDMRVELSFDLVTILLVSLRVLTVDGQRRDAHGRLSEAEDPVAYSHLADVPYVSHLVEVLLKAADSLLRSTSSFAFVRPRWPGPVEWVFGVSHDVDHLSKWPLRNRPLLIADLKRALVQRKHVVQATRALLTSMIGPKLGWTDPYQNVMEIAEMEHGQGLCATYFFGVANPKDSSFEVSYDPATLFRCVEFSKIIRMGHEIGLHGSYVSGENDLALSAEARELRTRTGTPVKGVRQHYLRFDWSSTPERQLKAGFAYDSSWGYVGRPGFPGGLGSPFVGRFPISAPSGCLVEIPMTVMDTTLREFLRLGFKESELFMRELVRNAKRANGLLVVNWHNNAFDREASPDDRRIFELLVQESLDRGATPMSLGTVAEWWRYRRDLRCVKHGDSIVIMHPQGLREMTFRILGGEAGAFLARGSGVEIEDDRDGVRGLQIPHTGSEFEIRYRA